MADEPEEGGSQGQKPSIVDKAKDVKDQVQKAKKINDMVQKAKMAKNLSMLGPLATVLLWVLVGILIIFVVVGIIMFLVTMPGLILEKFKQMANDFLEWCIAKTNGAENVIKEEELATVANYLESMGYDLKGYGFVSEEVETKEEVKDRDVYLDKNQGILRFADDNTVASINSRYIERYLTSNFYMYLIKNQNISIVSKWNSLNGLEKAGEVIGTAGSVVAGAAAGATVGSFFFPPIGTVVGAIIGGIAGASLSPVSYFNDVIFGGSPTYGTGLISLYEDDGTIGRIKGSEDSELASKIKVFMNVEAKTMAISVNEFFNKNNAMTYNLDGWTGRYGMPLEFLVSVHIATMAPDLAIEMATSFDTDVQVLLHFIDDAEISGGYLIGDTPSDDNIIQLRTIQETIDIGGASDNWWSSFVNWFDDLNFSDSEANKLFELGFDHDNANCTCGKKVTGAVKREGQKDDDKICSSCKDKLKDIMSALKEMNDYKFKTMTPYISRVENHWFRDVYFVTHEELETVQVDEDYLLETKERWTLFQVYTTDSSLAGDTGTDGRNSRGQYKLTDKEELDGDYVLYYEASGSYVDENGITRDYTKDSIYLPDYSDRAKEIGISEYAKEMSIPVIKKAITEMKDSGWSAYEESGKIEGEWEKIEIAEDAPAALANFKEPEKLFVKYDRVGDIVQKEDGVRGVTNETIKKLFLEDKYFIFDGSIETANKIMKVKEKEGFNDIGYAATTESDVSETAKSFREDRQNKIEEILKKKYVFVNGEIESVVNVDSDVSSQYANNTDPDKNVEIVKGSDLIHTVNITKDSLGAFTMLENMHSLDADYVYRDFKELIVELDYFDKEDLTAPDQEVFEWILPDTGSAGWPVRRWDKNENYYGSLIHSKADYELKRNEILEQTQEDENIDASEVVIEPTATLKQNILSGVASVGELSDMQPIDVANTVGDSLDWSMVFTGKEPSQVSVDEFLEAAAKIHEMMEEKDGKPGFEYCQGGNDKCEGYRKWRAY